MGRLGVYSAAAAADVVAAAIAAGVVVAAAAGVAVTVAAAAEQQNQDDDPPAVVPTKTEVAHKNTSEKDFSSGFAAHSMVFLCRKKVQPDYRTL